MRYYFAVVAWLCGGLALAQGLNGIFVLHSPSGILITRVQVTGESLRAVIEVPDGSTIQLKGIARNMRARGVAVSPHGNAEFAASVDGDLLNLVISQKAGPKQAALELPLQFRRAEVGQATSTSR